MLAISAVSLFGQSVGIGVKAGVPITDFVETVTGNTGSAFVHTKRYLVGPTVEFRFPIGLRLEIDALYRRLGYDYTLTGAGTTFGRVRADSWQFPVLGKWAFLPGPVKPFVDAGATFQHITNFDQFRSAVTGDSRNDQLGDTPTVGFTFGGGVEFKIAAVRISPEFRYTRWGNDAFDFGTIRNVLRTNRNQGDFLLGISF